MLRATAAGSTLLLVAALGLAQTPTSPSAQDNVHSAEEYASQILQDPMDMNERTDLGWFTFSPLDSPSPGMTGVGVSGGLFSATTSSTDPIITVLDTGIPDTAFLGKIGTNFRIDADKYTIFAVRMYLSTLPAPPNWGQLFWSKNTIYASNPGGGVSGSNGFQMGEGWRFYFINIPALGVLFPTDAGPWSGLVDSLRFDPVQASGVNLQIDWIRLVQNEPSLNRTITWSGGGSVDIYLDNDNNRNNGNLGLLAQGVSGGSYAFNPGSLAPGDYYVAMVSSGGNPTTSANHSPGFYRVNDIPTLQFTSPSPQGSSDDFATIHLGDAWDMSSTSDVDYNQGNNSLTVTTLDPGQIVNEAGSDIGPRTGIRGVSTPVGGSVGDPRVYTLFHTERGFFDRIDASKYRILVLDMGVEGDRDLVLGSVARIVWKRTVDALENVTEDIVVRSKSGPLVLDRFVADMATIPIEEPTAGSTDTGWNGLIDSFRVDAHEFPGSVAYFIDNVKLAAFERADTSYVVKWNYIDNSSGAPSMQLYYDPDRMVNGNETLITTLNPRTTTQATWNTSGVANGLYYIRATYSDGQNSNTSYSRWPVNVSHTPELPALLLDKQKLFFNMNSSRTAWTPAQVVRTTKTGTGSVNWTVSKSPAANWLSVSPTSGQAGDDLTISVNPTLFPASSWEVHVTVSSNDTSNGDRVVRVFGNYLTSPAPPFGFFDTPVDGVSGVTGAIPVTGWALDDIGVTTVQVFRDPVSGVEPPGNLVYLGDATLVEGARPDVEAIYTTTPLNYRASWGYAVLTNLLPLQGNGPYRLHVYATDVEGQTTYLGNRSFNADNANATKPFGTIDTPGQGGEISGLYRNWGWALAPQPNEINGSNIVVFVDGAIMGMATYGFPRSDIDTFFPDLKNTGGAVGYLDLDTTALADGVHTIAWRIEDLNGTAEGVGSRYFIVANGSSLSEMPVITADKTDLVFGAEENGPATGPQQVTLSPTDFGQGHWRVGVSDDFIRVSSESGNGRSLIDVAVDPSGLEPGDYHGTLFLFPEDPLGLVQTVGVHLTVYPIGSTAAPFGHIDTPEDETGVFEGPIGVMGWVLDDIEAVAVELWREPEAGEATDENGLVLLGSAILGSIPRPDVEGTYPSFPLVRRCSWSFDLDTASLPYGGNGDFTIHVIARDPEGHSAVLGTRRITASND